jgi:hypothetical protein
MYLSLNYTTKKYMKRILLSLAFMAALSLSAQTGYYQTPIAGSGNPNNLNADLEFPVGGGISAGWTTILTGPQSAAWSPSQTLPFAFKFNDAAVTTFTAHSTGVVTFDGSAATISATNTAIPSTGIPDKSVSLWGLRISNTGDYIITKTFGSAPNRQFWIQYNSASEANLSSGTSAGWCYMSIVLEETTNKIYIVDQRTNFSNTSKISAGIQIDGTTAIKVNNVHPFSARNSNLETPIDNRYFAFAPGIAPVNEAIISGISMDKFLIIGNAPYAVTYTVGNNGSAPITSLKVSYSINNGPAVEDIITGLNIASGASAQVTSTTKWNPTLKGAYDIDVNILEVNNVVDNLSDNSTTGKVNVVNAFVKRKVLHEQLTSSTCPPCTPGNINVNGILANATDYTIVKYQMNYPDTGDPYYNVENSTRHTYYAVGGIPNMVVDGKQWQGNSNSYTAGILSAAQEIPAFMEITGSAKNEWKNKISVDVTITPKSDFPANLRLFAVIVEKNTSLNVKTNGETEFDHVAKKIMPNTNGESLLALTDGTPVSKTLSFTFNGPYVLPASGASPANLATSNTVENWGNLQVVVWVQDFTTKEVFQSAAFDVANNSTEDISNKMNIFPNPAAQSVLVNADALKGTLTSVQLVNLMGQTVATGQTTNGQFTFDVSNLANGVYTVKMEGSAKQAVQKLVIQH